MHSTTVEGVKPSVFKDNKRLVVVGNSHSLSDYQQCPRKYEFTGIHKIEPAKDKAVFRRGTVISLMLQTYYQGIIDGLTVVERVMKALEILAAEKIPLVEKRIVVAPDNPKIKELIEERFMAYVKHYKHEGFIPVAVEQGFSKVLYEDSRVVFVYEGRPDLVMRTKDGRLIVFDHKSTERIDKITPLNNQSIGYCWATPADFFIYNYFGLQANYDPKTNFVRDDVTIDEKIIQPWLATTRNWYYKILFSEINYKKNIDVEGYHLDPSWQCDGKYGRCDYYSLCTSSSDAVMLNKIRQEFKINDYRSW